jgi:Nucleoside H+ symporter/Thioredoxin-like
VAFQTLHFSGQQVGIVAGATAVGAIIAPFFVGVVADELFATEKVLGVLHLGGGVLLLLASQQGRFAALYSIILLYCLCYMPTMALTNSLSFRQMSDPKIEFGGIRVLGTCGWIVAGLLIGSLGLEATSHPLQIAAGASILMGFYCFTLPHTPPLARGGKQERATGIFPKESRTLLNERSMAVFAIALGRWPARRSSTVAAVALIGLAMVFPLRKSHTQAEVWEPWSPESLAAARSSGNPVFVDFTAAWCLSCQVNEATVLRSQVIREKLEKQHFKLLKADWTQYDPKITATLRVSIEAVFQPM